jgi:integrase
MRTPTPYTLVRVDGSPFWYVYFLDRAGSRVRKSTKEHSKERAHAVARELERRYGDPTYNAANATTLSDAARSLKEHLENTGRSSETRAFYGVKLGHVGRVLGTDCRLADVTAPAVDGYIRLRRAEGAARYTIAKELTALRMLLKVARRRGEFDREVSQVMPVGFATGYKPRMRRLTRGDAWALIAMLPEPCGRYAAFVCATTARDSAVGRAIGSDRLATGIRVRDAKTRAAARVVPFTAVTAAFADFAFLNVAPDAAVAPGLGSVRHAFDRACARLGFPHTSPNDLRRSVAHWLLEESVPRDVVAAFMGHTSTKMLDSVYGKLDPTQIGEAIARAVSMRAPE